MLHQVELNFLAFTQCKCRLMLNEVAQAWLNIFTGGCCRAATSHILIPSSTISCRRRIFSPGSLGLLVPRRRFRLFLRLEVLLWGPSHPLAQHLLLLLRI